MWAIFFKVFAKFVETLLLLYVLFFGCQACGIIAPWKEEGSDIVDCLQKQIRVEKDTCLQKIFF